MSAVEPAWLDCRCGSPDVQAILILTPDGRGVLTTCKQCGFRVEYRKVKDRVREFVHVPKGETEMAPVSVESSVIQTVSFDEDRSAIRVDFRNGAAYEYTVDPGAEDPPNIRVLYLSLIHAESAGQFFSKFIRPKSSKLIATKLPEEKSE